MKSTQFGFKVVDKKPNTLGPLLEYAVEHRVPVEMGLYFAEPEALNLMERHLANADFPVNAHTDHRKICIANLHQSADLLAEHIRLAKSLGSRYSVIHVAYMPLSFRVGHRDRLVHHLLDNLKLANDLSSQHDYPLYVENVFHSLDFYRELFEQIIKHELTQLNHCFDIGHAKVWSNSRLEDWMTFMGDLKNAGKRLHCHLHANDGLTDAHLSLHEWDELTSDARVTDFHDLSELECYWALERRFPEAVKVFEVKAEMGIQNLERVLQDV